MRHAFIAPVAVLLAVSVSVDVQADDPNALTVAERAAGFTSLFDGRSLEGWEAARDAKWGIDDGAIYVESAGEWGFDRGIICRAHRFPNDFELVFQWRETPLTQAVRAQEIVINGRMSFALSFGVISRNFGTMPQPDIHTAVAAAAFEAGGRTVRMSTGTVELPIVATIHERASFSNTSNFSDDMSRPIGEWNTGRIVHRQGLVQFWVNGLKVNETDTRREHDHPIDPNYVRWTAVARNGLYFGFEEGPFLNGRPAWYRGIKVRAVQPDEPVDRTPIAGERK